MTTLELLLCCFAVMTSSAAQLCLKSVSSSNGSSARSVATLLVAFLFMGCSVLLVILALRSLPLSRLMTFAAGAYILVPLGSNLLFDEKLTVRFWTGACLIAVGVAWSYG